MLFKKVLQLSAIIVLIGTLFSCGMQPAKHSQDAHPVFYKSATELTKESRKGEITSSKLLDIYLERIKCYNAGLNAVVAMDVKAARKRAAQADKATAQGKSAQQIGNDLGISRRTVESHKIRIIKKLGIKTSADIIRFAVEHGLTKSS